tara:strand:- start:1300 stop:1902 length:603 start_codon:yes stop_codon:yes gene_type:complete
MERQKRLRIIQVCLLIFGLLIVFFTYKLNNKSFTEKTNSKLNDVSKQDLKDITKTEGDVFYNIEYVGLDLAGNRYILKSKEAYTDKNSTEIINLKLVEAVFYFKDGTILNIYSEEGNYNNLNLNMNFYGNVKGVYGDSKLFAQKAEYSNSESMLLISDKVKVNDPQGTLYADKLLFDIKKQKLNITSFKNNKINANINLK